MSMHPAATPAPALKKPATLREFALMRERGEKLAILTCYDASFAALLHRTGVDALMVGDSLGNVIQGHRTTLPVTLEQIEYHVHCVARGAPDAFIIADLPFGSYQESPQQALRSGAQLLSAGAHMVKLEGGEVMAETVRMLVERGLPVCAHIGLTPQSVHQLGGFHVQGRNADQAQRLLREARMLEQAGAAFIVLELVPSQLAADLTAKTSNMVTIGIGAGAACHGQVLVLYDMLGLFPGKRPRFVHNFLEGAATIESAVADYVQAVKQGRYPAAEHIYL